MTEERFIYLFNQQLKGECSALEYREYTGMLKSGKFDHVASRLMDEHWIASNDVELDTTVSQDILRKIFAHKEVKWGHKILFENKNWIAVAAAAIALIVSSVLLFKPNPADPIPAPAGQLSALTVPVAKRSYVTTNEHQKVTLPDGSTVILNNNSTLKIASNFNQERREVEIIGEGYFDIKHDIKKAFIVSSGKVKTTVLGTAFNVRAYINNKVEVTVTRGKVSVLSGHNVLGILTPNKRIIVPQTGVRPQVSTVVASNSIKWQENDLFFDNMTFDAATVILSKKFNTPITIVDDRAKSCRFTATFLQGETLDEVLKVICSFNNAQYHKNADGILINGPGC